jgi:SNF2 family DNA or RNA helicase
VEEIKKAGLRALVASSPGTGKTPVAARCIEEGAPSSLPALVICPASVTLNWARELGKWAPSLKVHVIEGGSGSIPRPTKSTVYIISWALLDARWQLLSRIGIRMVVADEAHFSRNIDTLRAQALWQIIQRVPHLLLLTGTPIVNNEQELQVLKSMLGDEPLMIRRLLEDVAPDVPPKTRSYIPIQLREKDTQNYDKANKEFEEWLHKERLLRHELGLDDIDIERTLAAEALAKVGYLRRLLGEAKAYAAADWIARAVRLGEPVVVFLDHQNVLNRLSKALRKQRIRHEIIDGSTTTASRQQYVDDFQANRFPVIICTRAAKEGITLTAARHLLFVERFFTCADEEQAEDRIRRLGQKHPTTIWYLHVPDTIDDRVDQIVKSKRQIVRTAIGSASTEETPTANVAAMLKSWAEYTETDLGPPTALGLGEALPALPKPKDTHGIVFYGERWQPISALRWCRMNGYQPTTKSHLEGRLKIVCHPANVFQDQKFDQFLVSRDIRIITGKRMSKANENIVRRAMQR